LINYMVEEMDHLQNINISEIINEKIKTETIIRNIADGLIVTDSKDRILVVNSVAEKWFNLKEKEVVHKLLNKCLKIEAFVMLMQNIKQGKDKPAEEFTYRVIGERRERVFQAHASKVKGKKKEFIGIVTVIRDVTREREADRLKTDLVSMVAHELKSPLTSIFGFSELLLESNLKDSQSKEYVQVIQTESSRLTELINKFLDLSKLEAGKTEVRMIPFNLKQVVEQVLETNRMQVEKKEIRTITDIQENLSFAFGDQDMIEQVLQNLYSNAIKYSPKRSKIGIEVKEDKDEIMVNVIDNGYGIPKDALPNIFDKFFRVVDAEGYDAVEGSGLGLALSKEIIERHGGTISVKSRLGVGSVFTFTLPRSNATLSGQTGS
jgi:PAS domain S-box-containing protein